MNIDQQFPSKYLAAGDLPDSGDMIVTIKGITVEVLGQGEKAENKPILYFQEIPKGMACNKTNANTIKGLYGAETDNWVGKRLALFAAEVDFQGRQVLAIRVRMRAPAGPVQAAAEGKPELLTLEQALAALSEVGIDRQAFKAELKAKNGGDHAAYKAERDTALVRDLIAANTAPVEEPF